MVTLSLLVGGMTGYNLHPNCESKQEFIYKTDTIEHYVSGSPFTIISKPINTIIHDTFNQIKVVQKLNTKYIHDTTFLEYPTFTSYERIKYDSLYVDITDTGNCNGIITRHSVFGGKIKERIITNTIEKIVNQPISLFQLNAGLKTTFTNKWQLQDLAPSVQLSFKQKHSIGYDYQIQSKQHSLTFLTKIK